MTYFYYAAPTSSTPSAGDWIGIGVAIPALIMFISAIVISIFLRRHLHRDRPRNPLYIDHTTSTHNTAYSMNQRSLNSNQAPPQNVHGARPTGQYASSPYRTSYPQQPPAPYSLGEPPSAPYSTEEPPSAPYPTEKLPPVLYFSGGEAPPPYPG